MVGDLYVPTHFVPGTGFWAVTEYWSFLFTSPDVHPSPTLFFSFTTRVYTSRTVHLLLLHPFLLQEDPFFVKFMSGTSYFYTPNQLLSHPVFHLTLISYPESAQHNSTLLLFTTGTFLPAPEPPPQTTLGSLRNLVLTLHSSRHQVSWRLGNLLNSASLLFHKSFDVTLEP